MFGLLNTTQIYGIQQHQVHDHEQQQKQFHIITKSLATSTTITTTTNTSNPNYQTPHRRSHSSVSDTGHRFFASLAAKNPTNFIEKFLKTDLQSTYDTIKSYHRNYPANNQNTTASSINKRHSDPLHYESGSKLTAFNCLQGSYRHSFDGEFYVPVKVNNNSNSNNSNNNNNNNKDSEMTIKCSKNLLAVDAVEQGPATLQNYQKIPESEHDLLVDSLVASSGASSGEFNSSSDGNATTGNSSSSSSSGNSGSSSLSSSNLYKRLSFGGRNSQNTKSEKNGDSNTQSQQQQQQNAVPTDNSITLNLSASSIIPSVKSIELQRSSSSTSSSGDFLSKRERKKGAMTPQPEKTPLANLLPPSCLSAKNHAPGNTPTSPEKAQRRRLLQMLTSYDQQNKFLQRELAKEKRRRTEELACVVKSLLCFEAKLKNDMKAVNQRLQDKDTEICRLVRQNRALRKKLNKLQQEARDSVQDEGVVEDNDDDADANTDDVNEDGDKDLKDLLEDCLVLEALQCINCRKQFYDIEVTDNYTQTQGANSLKDSNGKRNNDDPTTEHGSSSDDTVSSSFFGARRSVRYTSKRTSGTFRDYMRSRAMNIDDPALENDINAGEEYATQASYDKLNIYSRTMERMHGVKSESERDSEHSGLDCSSSITRSNSRASTKSSKSTISTATSKASEISHNLEEDDGIFSPTQDEDFDEELLMKQETKLKTVRGSALEAFSEASPKQIYETSLDDWYASNSDQEEISASAAVTSKSYGQGAVNPVLECVNQILLQQSMEGVEERSQTPKNSNHTINNTTLPRRSSLSDRRNQRSNSRASDSCLPGSRNGTLTRKRVHFSTKNSMVHVPRNDETEEDEEELKSSNMISNYQGMANAAAAAAAAYITHSPVMDSHQASPERLETFNYESIYSNEYEPIGSELNSSNLYVDMDSNSKTHNLTNEHNNKNNANKLPPALPPKPANLLKFKKSLQQLDESPDELMEAHNNTAEVLVEPDYCSISEVNVGITSVQIRADIHRAPLSERDLESVIEHENDLDAATEISEANSHKTEEIEEIFADIPKLPNVAAIIAPKSSLKQNDYLIMTPKQDNKLGIMALTAANNNTTTTATSNATTNNMLLNSTPCNKPDRKALKLNLSPINGILTNTTLKTNKTDCNSVLRPQLSSANYQQQYKRKHMPNILQEINKRLSLPNSPITPTTPKSASTLYNKSTTNDADCLNSLPLQAEFDWYNLDAEYGKNTQTELLKNNENLNTVVMPTLLADIKEDGESLITTADEYNLDEEYKNEMEQEESDAKNHYIVNDTLLCEAINNHPSSLTKAKKIKKNLANFEKFIETTSLTSKPLPTKRKIYFAGPFV